MTRIRIRATTVCLDGSQRYSATVTSDSGTLAWVDCPGRDYAVRSAVESARYTLRTMREFRRGADIT